MKKVLLSAACAIALFASCNKDTPNPASYIIGKWKTEKTISTYTVPIINITYTDTLYPSACQGDNFTFYGLNGKGYNNGGDSLCAGEVPVDSFQYTHSMQESRIFQINLQAGTIDTLTVKTLTENTLIHTRRSIGVLGISTLNETHLTKLP